MLGLCLTLGTATEKLERVALMRTLFEGSGGQRFCLSKGVDV